MNRANDPKPEFQPAAVIWKQTLEDLRLQLTRATFERLLARSQPLAWEPEANAWTIAVQPHAVDWLVHQWAPRIRRMLGRYTAGYPAPTVAFVPATQPSAPEEVDVAAAEIASTASRR